MAKHTLLSTLSLLILIVILVFIQPATLWAVPAFLDNGVYEVTFEPYSIVQPQAHFFHYAIDPYTNYTSVKEHSRQVPPPKHGVQCTDKLAEQLNSTDIDLARRMLENWCEAYGIHKQAIVLAVHNGVVWYLCSWVFQYYLKKYEMCGRREVRYSEGEMDGVCGKDMAGGLGFWNLRKYGRTKVGWNICEERGLGLEVLTRTQEGVD
ncbi:hypothetical protein E4U60_007819 [Claviceps pazoutovae]|uniref:Uncharacterized protein n=1 Tax=Claviceps pazoutovae TaxID=1649127 RepID=A0A9P7SBT8_9HYPO|nr:hypothetical protein E4U60_007819 [Claviceps pazoutovae]